ncbi:unnamed protein product, partial [Cuscuta europaea]
MLYEERCKASEGEQGDSIVMKDDTQDKLEEELATFVSRVSWEKVDVNLHISKIKYATHSIIQVKVECAFRSSKHYTSLSSIKASILKRGSPPDAPYYVCVSSNMCVLLGASRVQDAIPIHLSINYKLMRQLMRDLMYCLCVAVYTRTLQSNFYNNFIVS